MTALIRLFFVINESSYSSIDLILAFKHFLLAYISLLSPRTKFSKENQSEEGRSSTNECLLAFIYFYISDNSRSFSLNFFYNSEVYIINLTSISFS